MLKNIIIGLIISTISFFLLKYNEWLVQQTGTWDWAERVIGTEGGTRLVLKLVAILGVVIGLLTIFGLHDNFVKLIFAPLLKTPLT